jgi:hypothetical protein
MFCGHCGKEIDDNAAFCDYCGTKIKSGKPAKSSDAANIQNNRNNSNAQTAPAAPVNKPAAPTVAVKKTGKKTSIIITIVVAVVIVVVVIGALFCMQASDKKRFEEDNKTYSAIQNDYFSFLPDITIGELLNNTHSWLEPNNDGKDDNMWMMMNKCPTFSGVNDETGVTLEITFSGYCDTNGNPVIFETKINSEDDPALKEMKTKDFENYILDLYASYKGTDSSAYKSVPETNTYKKDETTIAATTATTAATTTTTVATTTTAATTAKAKKVTADYQPYRVTIELVEAQVEKEYANSLIYCDYTLYDLNQDGIYELIVHLGESEADAQYAVYTLDEDTGITEVGELVGGSTYLTEQDGKLYTNFGHSGYQVINEIQMVEDLGSWILLENTVFEEDGLAEYTSYGTTVQEYDVSDLSPIDKLCPEADSVDRPYVDAHVETLRNGGADGSVSYLYADGDFDYIVVHRIDTDGDETYDDTFTKADCAERVDLHVNAIAIAETYLCIVPYYNSGVMGDMIVCDVPDEVSGTDAVTKQAVDMKGQINCHGGTVAGFTTAYICEAGEVSTVRKSLGDGWHITAKNKCVSYGVTWYELWDSDDGDYYGWVDESYIDFY